MVEMTDSVPDRLREARIRAGFKSAAAAARANGWKEAAYRHHENGTRGFDLKSAIMYANAFGANFRYILGLDPAFDAAGVHELVNVFEPTPDVKLRSALLRALRSLFGIELVRGINPEDEFGIGRDLDFSKATYHAFNRSFLDSIDPQLTEGNAAVMIMVGNTMGETAPDGSMLLLDTRAKLREWPNSIWVIYTEGQVLVRRVLIGEDTWTLRADLHDVPEQQVPAGEYGAIGRVLWIGKSAQ